MVPVGYAARFAARAFETSLRFAGRTGAGLPATAAPRRPIASSSTTATGTVLHQSLKRPLA